MFGIGELARKAGMAASTIRYYERIGLLPPSKRVNTKRRYDKTILPKLRLIRMAQEAGFTIAEIQQLLHDFPNDASPAQRWQSLASNKMDELDRQMKQIRAMKSLLKQTLICACKSIEDCPDVIEDTSTVEA